MELKEYWFVIRRRWLQVVACLVGAMAVAALLTWQTTPLYSSTARLFVSTSPSDTNDAYTGGLFATQRVASYADLVQSTQLAERVGAALGGGADESVLRGQVTASVVPETVILEISATDPDPERARAVAQAYAEGLSDLVVDLETPSGQRDALIKASIVDDAQVSNSAVSPQPVRNLALAGVLGLLLGIGLAVVRHLLDTTIGSSDDVAAITPTPILANITTDSESAQALPREALGGTSPWAEAFRVLRTNMQYVDVDTDKKVFVVSSSLPGEGKSTIAASLAITLALADHRVALVECDLRKPQLARRLGLDDSVGTTGVLIGRISLDDALQEYTDTGLQVLVCGHIPPNPSELLQSTTMEKLLIELKQRFEIVILDAPPLLPVTDAAVLAREADGALLVVRHGKTTRDQLMHSLERLEAVDARCLGVVVNRAPTSRSSGGYGYGYGYGYGAEPQATATRSSTIKSTGSRPGRRKRA
ncbi:MAG: polysaccharide biosynthesis tyrosine autokinase [Nocardioides sp.]